MHAEAGQTRNGQRPTLSRRAEVVVAVPLAAVVGKFDDRRESAASRLERSPANDRVPSSNVGQLLHADAELLGVVLVVRLDAECGLLISLANDDALLERLVAACGEPRTCAWLEEIEA